ncbi:hypothetical protein Ae201684P_016643 [Aphanomyces euteiches]|nr:hypothetical protein Ae201684P_016643 [Aphanomyces euteiches]
MGRRGRHSAKTGDGGAERRLAKRLEEQRKGKMKNFQKADDDLVFHDDPSDDNNEDEGNSDESEESEQEVMQLNDTDDESDLEERDDLGDEVFDEEEFAEEKERVQKMKDQWGSSKKQFYSADTADYEMDSDMEDIAKDEEEAALELQRKQAELMDEDDFAVTGGETSQAVDEDEEARVGDALADIPLVKSLPLSNTSPELLGLLDELNLYLAQYEENIRPAVEKLREWNTRHGKFATGLAFMEMKQELVLNYTMNISFYLQCKAQGKSMTDHPVLTHILSLREKLTQCEKIDQPLDDQLDALLNVPVPDTIEEEPVEEDDGMDAFFDREEEELTQDVQETSKAKKSAKRKQAPVVVDEEADAFYEAVAQAKKSQKKLKAEFYAHEPKIVESEFNEDNDDEDKKRGATYQMIKNKGLKAHKSKINRNPRVKKRMQYKKALVRRKGQVREVRTGEAARYGGELTGIKSNITRSRKL